MDPLNPLRVGFGRRYSPDPRDANFPMALRLDPARAIFFPKGVPTGSRHYLPAPPIINQGNTGTCVAHGCTTYINAAPFMQKLPMSPYDLYRKIVATDEFPENDAEATAPDAQLQGGTSVRAGIEELRREGYISNYLWAENIEDARAWLMTFSGLIGGFNWTAHMMNTDSDGFVSYSGSIEGGHCVYLGGWNDRVKHNGRIVRAARFQQSWGLPWGQGGRGWIVDSDLAKMIEDQGEVAAPVEVRVLPLKKVPDLPDAHAA